MTVKELKNHLMGVPDDMDVMIEQNNDESRYSMSQTAAIDNVEFQDPDIPKKEWPTEKCFIISDIF